MIKKVALCIGGHDEDRVFIESLANQQTYFTAKEDTALLEERTETILQAADMDDEQCPSLAYVLLNFVKKWCMVNEIDVDNITDVFIGNWDVWENLLTTTHNRKLPWDIHTTTPSRIVVVGTWEELADFDKNDPIFIKNGFVVERVIYINNYPKVYECYKVWLSDHTDVLLLLNPKQATAISEEKEKHVNDGNFVLGYDLELGMLTNLHPAISKSLLVHGNMSRVNQYRIKFGHGYKSTLHQMEY